MILLHLIRSKNKISLPTLVRRLEELNMAKPPIEKISIKEEIELPEPVVEPPVEIKEIVTPIPPTPLPPPATPAEPPQQKSENIVPSPPGRHEVLLRFASVELEGTLLKEKG